MFIDGEQLSWTQPESPEAEEELEYLWRVFEAIDLL